MAQDNQDSLEQQHYKMRLRSLRIVLVLTFIGSGMMLLSSLFTAVMLPFMQEMRDSGAIEMTGIMAEMYEMVLAIPQAYYAICAVLYALSLAGAIMMWQLRKNGFHFYTTAQLLVIANVLVFIGRSGILIGDIMLTVLFVAYYYFALRNLGMPEGD